jgi:hypothetical protein
LPFTPLLLTVAVPLLAAAAAASGPAGVGAMETRTDLARGRLAKSGAPAALTVADTRFLLDGRPTFLFGVSLFDALGPAPPRVADLNALGEWGVNTIRVWAHWNEPIYQADGALTSTGRERLLTLVKRLQGRRMVLELVLLRPGQLPGQPYAIFSSEAARLRAVTEMTAALRDYRNVLFDLYNEHDHGDGPISHEDARALRDAVKAADPARIVTISSTGGHLGGGRSTVDAGQNLREEAGQGPQAVYVDVVAPHFPRTGDWDAATDARVRAVRAQLDTLGRQIPIYLNEEQRTDTDTIVPPEAYRRAITAAMQAGAAGWVFHTAAGFALEQRPFLDALTPNEREALPQLLPGTP